MFTQNLIRPVDINFNLEEIQEIGERIKLHNEEVIKQIQNVEHFMRKLVWAFQKKSH